MINVPTNIEDKLVLLRFLRELTEEVAALKTRIKELET